MPRPANSQAALFIGTYNALGMASLCKPSLLEALPGTVRSTALTSLESSPPWSRDSKSPGRLAGYPPLVGQSMACVVEEVEERGGCLT